MPSGGQNSTQAQQLLILRQQMRVFEEQLTRALQDPDSRQQQHLFEHKVTPALPTFVMLQDFSCSDV